MSTWIDQLSTWIERQEPLPPPEIDDTIRHFELLIDQSDEIEKTYSQVLQRLSHDRSYTGSKAENR